MLLKTETCVFSFNVLDLPVVLPGIFPKSHMGVSALYTSGIALLKLCAVDGSWQILSATPSIYPKA